MKSCNKRMEVMPFGGLYEIFSKANKLEEEGLFDEYRKKPHTYGDRKA